jgi:hypothetical protein
MTARQPGLLRQRQTLEASGQRTPKVLILRCEEIKKNIQRNVSCGPEERHYRAQGANNAFATDHEFDGPRSLIALLPSLNLDSDI